MAEAGASDCAELDRSASDVWRAGEAHAQRRSDRQLLVHIRAIHRRHKGRYGALRVTAELCEPGFMVNRKRVARIMRDHDIQGRVNRRFRATTTDSTHRMPVAPIRLMWS